MESVNKKFAVNGNKYTFWVDDYGNVAFKLDNVPVLRKADKYTFDDVIDPTGDVGYVGGGAFEVFATVRGLLLDFVYSNKPYAIHFYPSTDKKYSLYKRFAKLLERELTDYVLVEHDNAFYFYKKL
jgi:hypothetical protein